MAKSPFNKLRRGKTRAYKLSNSSEQNSEAYRILQAENRRLWYLVVSLSAVLSRNIMLGFLSEHHAVTSADATQSKPRLGVLSKPSPIHELLTLRERAVLGEIMKGASSKEAAQTLAISVRTVEFHRANILQKLAAKNTADLMRIVLSE